MGGASAGIANNVGAWASVFNLGNCAIGAGMLTFPYAFQCAGVLGGTCMCLIIAALELYTLNVLARQSTKHHAYTYQGLVYTVLGKGSFEVMSWVIFFYLWGSCVAYLIIVGDTFGSVFREFVVNPYGLPTWLATRQVMILVPAVTIILPLSLQRSMGALAPTSTIAVVVMAATALVVVYKAIAASHTWHWGALLPSGVHLWKIDWSTFAAMPVMVFAYHCHVQSVPIYYELVEDPRLFPCCDGARRRRRGASAPALPLTCTQIARQKLSGMSRVLAMAYLECTVMYIAVGIAGYVTFPNVASSNVLNNFGQKDGLMQLVRFLVGWAVLFHYPINQHVARSAMYDLACRYTGVEQKHHVPYTHLASITVVFFIAATATACLVEDLGVVFQMLGGIAGSMLIFILPGALLMRPSAPATGLHHAGSFLIIEDSDALGDEEDLVVAPVLTQSALECASEEADADVQSHALLRQQLLEARAGEARPERRVYGALLCCLGVATMTLTLALTVASFSRGAHTARHSTDALQEAAGTLPLLAVAA